MFSIASISNSFGTPFSHLLENIHWCCDPSGVYSYWVIAKNSTDRWTGTPCTQVYLISVSVLIYHIKSCIVNSVKQKMCRQLASRDNYKVHKSIEKTKVISSNFYRTNKMVICSYPGCRQFDPLLGRSQNLWTLKKNYNTLGRGLGYFTACFLFQKVSNKMKSGQNSSPKKNFEINFMAIHRSTWDEKCFSKKQLSEINFYLDQFQTDSKFPYWQQVSIPIKEASLVIVYPPGQKFPSNQFDIITVYMGYFLGPNWNLCITWLVLRHFFLAPIKSCRNFSHTP